MWMWSTGINRNIVECKENNPVLNEDCKTVLIETLWNVKGVMNLAAASGEDRINRNIVECKGIFDRRNCCRIACINRNIVECKVV